MTIQFEDEFAWYPPGVKQALTSLQQERFRVNTSNRKPRINTKPTKGMKMFLAQGVKAMKKALRIAMGPRRPDQWWHTGEAMRSMWLISHSRSKYRPHQGAQEKARRVRQMQTYKCINPEVWALIYLGRTVPMMKLEDI